jgi:hypothetical protein
MKRETTKTLSSKERSCTFQCIPRLEWLVGSVIEFIAHYMSGIRLYLFWTDRTGKTDMNFLRPETLQ